MSKYVFVSVVSVLVVAAAIAGPQQEATKPAPAPTTADGQKIPDGGMPTYIHPETPERRMQRLGTTEDPGIDPDPNKHYWRFGYSFRISKYDRTLARYDREPGTVRPLGMINFAYEIYQQNEKYVWVWIPDALPADELAKQEEPAPDSSVYSKEAVDFFRRERSQFVDLTPPPANKSVRFVESSTGLPAGGSWRNSLAVADMNNDGFVDLVTPPERGGRSTTFPSIFLGDGKGQWKFWSEVQWPQSLDYGGVAAADFNKDGKTDLAFAVHLRGLFVFLNQGNGKFIASNDGLPNDWPTRRVVTADVDRDGFADVVAISEGSTAAGTTPGAKVRAFLNRKKGTKWEQLDVIDPSLLAGGDWLTVADLNDDSQLDFVTASTFFGSTSVVHLSAGPKKWQEVKNFEILPPLSYFFANASGKFSSKKRNDAVIAYVRHWPSNLDARLVPEPPMQIVTNVDRLTVTPQGMKREAIMRWGGREGVWGMAAGDVDGDGNDDIMFTRHQPREMGLLLGDGQGGFTLAGVEGIPLQANPNYDLKIADVNGDRKLDVIIMYETGGTTALADRDGRIQVFLNRGAAASATAAKE